MESYYIDSAIILLADVHGPKSEVQSRFAAYFTNTDQKVFLGQMCPPIRPLIWHTQKYMVSHKILRKVPKTHSFLFFLKRHVWTKGLKLIIIKLILLINPKILVIFFVHLPTTFMYAKFRCIELSYLRYIYTWSLCSVFELFSSLCNEKWEVSSLQVWK